MEHRRRRKFSQIEVCAKVRHFFPVKFLIFSLFCVRILSSKEKPHNSQAFI